MKTVCVIENFAGTTTGGIGRALAARGAVLDRVVAHQGMPVPRSADRHDALIVLGGGQNARDDAGSPFLPAVVDAIRAFHAADRPVLGICLGSQLIARAFAADNLLGRPLEFGWHPVRATSAGANDPLLCHLGEEAPQFHWHTDSFTLPEGAVHLAESSMTAHQAFRLGRATYGLQFHVELERRDVAEASSHFRDYIAARSPDWEARHPQEAARHGAAADRASSAIAGAFARLVCGD